MTIIISPKPQVLHRLAQERSRQTEEKLKAEKAGLDPTGTVNEDLDEDLDDEDEEEDDDDDDEAGGEDDEA